MTILFFLILFLLGSAVGSFLTVIIDRLPHGESIFFGRSHCDNCKKKLGPLDLIPIVSYFLIKGKCRYCKHSIDWHYPLIEVITGIAFVFIGTITLPPTISVSDSFLHVFPYFYITFLLCCFIILFFIDLYYGIIPFSIMLVLLLVTLMWYGINMIFSTHIFLSGTLLNGIFSGTGAFLFFLSLYLLTKKKGIGFGDVIYALYMGFLLGFPGIIVGFYVSFLTGAIVSLILIIVKKKKLRGTTIPFGPFLVSGTFVAFFWGPWLMNIILRLFNL